MSGLVAIENNTQLPETSSIFRGKMRSESLINIQAQRKLFLLIVSSFESMNPPQLSPINLRLLSYYSCNSIPKSLIHLVPDPVLSD